jgi:hypothetical protein
MWGEFGFPAVTRIFTTHGVGTVQGSGILFSQRALKANITYKACPNLA